MVVGHSSRGDDLPPNARGFHSIFSENHVKTDSKKGFDFVVVSRTVAALGRRNLHHHEEAAAMVDIIIIIIILLLLQGSW